MKKILVSLILAVSLTATGVPVMAAQTSEGSESTALVSSGTVSFDQGLADLFDNSMTITDSQIFQVAGAMQNDFSKLEESTASDKDEAEGLIKSFEAAKAQYFLGRGDCAFGTGIQQEWDRENQYVRFGFSHGETITTLLPRVRVDQVTEDGDTLAVDLYEWMTVGYHDQGSTAVNASGTGYQFTLHLKQDADGWQIDSVSGTEANYADLEEEGIQISDDGISVTESDESEEALTQAAADQNDPELVGAGESTDSSGYIQDFSWDYHIADAIEYANTYALQRNTDYTWWGGRGGDCSNFVSQCLHAGGFPSTNKWYKDSVAWISQNDLRAYLQKIGAGKLIENPKSSDILVGNPVWYNWDGKGSSTNHVTICVGKNASGEPVIDSHTANKYHYKWNYGQSGTTFMTMHLVSSGTYRNPKVKGEIYRLYNPYTGEHFYTSSMEERTNLTYLGWKAEGVGWVSGSEEGGNPIYRLFNPNASDHHYTTNKGEMETLVSLGWNYEGVIGYAPKNTDTPLYRLYNPNATTGAHHYTTNKGEIEYLRQAGWNYEGICWYSNAIPKD